MFLVCNWLMRINVMHVPQRPGMVWMQINLLKAWKLDGDVWEGKTESSWVKKWDIKVLIV